MSYSFRTLLTALVLLALPMGLLAQVSVTDVTASQRQDGSGTVDVEYTLSGATEPVTVVMQVSPDGGENWHPVTSVTGSIGDGVITGTHSIVWDAKENRPEVVWPNAQIKIMAWSAEEITINLPGDVPLVMVRIPAGSFVMGSPSDEPGRYSNEGPQTNVTLTQNFYMGKYPVTQGQWESVMGSWPDTAPSSTFGIGPDNPAYYISWDDAQSFITELNNHIDSSGQGPVTMRLPTEAEWEYAARAGTTTRFFFGDSMIDSGWEDPSSNGDWCEDDGIRSQYMWYCGNHSPDGVKPVGGKLPNAFGLYDIHGNVWEMCEDLWGIYPGGSVTDPMGPSEGLNRIHRGGSWGDFARNVRSAFRSAFPQSARNFYIGFRLAASGPEAPDGAKAQAAQLVVGYSNLFEMDTRLRGGLQVTITPQEAIDAGAQWRRVGTEPWLESGEVESPVPAGEYQIEFREVEGWTPPDVGSVSILDQETTELTVLFELISSTPTPTPTVTPTPTPAPFCVGDANGDGVINLQDFIAVRDNFGQTNPTTGDANGDGVVNLQDFVGVRDNFGRTCD